MAARMTKRKDNRFAATVTVDGKKHFFYGRTQTEAKAKAQAARDRRNAGAPVKDATRTLSDWLGEWQQTFLKASSRSPKSKEMHSLFCRVWITPTIGTERLDKLNAADVVRLMQAMEDAGRAADTRRNCYNTLRAALDDAVSNGLLARNPAYAVSRPACPQREARFLTPEEVSAFLNAAEGLRYSNVLRLILGTGLRRGEALALRWGDVDTERGEVRVNGSLGRSGGVLRLTAPKTKGSRRPVSLSPAMTALLKAQKAAQAAERLKAANLWDDSGLVFTSRTGAPVDPRNVLSAAKRAAANAGLQGVGVHTLRHTYAHGALMSGVPLIVVSRNLGHSTIRLTADTYGHVTDDAARAANVAVSAVFGL